MTDVTVQPPETWGELSEAMKALNEKQRLFVRYLLLQKPGRGALTKAYRLAGYGNPARPQNARKDAHALSREPKIIEAIVDEGKRYVRGVGYGHAVAALMNMVSDPKHKDHGRAVAAILDRVDAVATRHDMVVTHRHEDPDRTALEELKALRKLGTGREKLLELYGANGLDRLELLEAAETAQRVAAAKVIDHDAQEVVGGQG